jgi:hypothetical protein
MLSLRPSHGSSSQADHGMRLLYVSSGVSEIDSSTTRQLAKVLEGAQVIEVDSTSAAIAAIRDAGSPFRAVLTSPGFNEKQTLSLILGLRRAAGEGIAVVPVVTEAHRGLCTSAVPAGAEAVMLMVNGLLIDARETLGRVQATPPPASVDPSTPAEGRAATTVAATHRALTELRKLHSLLYGKGRVPDDETTEIKPGDGGRLGLNARLSPPKVTSSPAGAAPMIEKPRPTPAAPASPPTTPQRRPVLQSVHPPRDPRVTSDKPRAALEAALQASRVESRRAADAHAAERDVWEATRRELEARLDQVESGARSKADLESALNDARKKFGAATDAYTVERAAWETTRKELEVRVKTLQAVVGGTRKIEDELKAARAELKQLTSADSSRESEWEETRRQLESELEARTRELEASNDARVGLATALQAAHAELRDVSSSQSTKEAVWEEARRQLTQQIYELQSSAGHSAEQARDEAEQAARTELERAKNMTERASKEIEQANIALERAREDAEEARHETERMRADFDTRARAMKDLERSLKEMRADVRRLTEDHDEERANWETEREELEQRARGGSSNDQERRRLDGALQELRSEHSLLAANYRTLEGQLRESQQHARQLTGEVESLRSRPAAPAELSGPLAGAEVRRVASRVEEVGKLGTAMAPEIEALVSSVDQCAAKLLQTFDKSDPRRAEAEVILKQSGRATSLLRQLLTFSRRQARPVAKIDLNEIVKRAEPTLARLVGGDIELKIAVGQPSALAMSEDDLDQLITALVFSARDSLTMGGSVILSTSVAGDGKESPRAVLAATASGYGAQPAKGSSALDNVLRRCGGELTLGGEPNRDAVLQVSLPQA